MARARREPLTGEGAENVLAGPPRLDQPGIEALNATEERQTFHPLLELTLNRLREFLREKEAVFWVFVFPVLMAFALGIAFRNTTPEKLRIAVESNAVGSNAVESNAVEHDAAGRGGSGSVEIYDALRRSADIEPLLLSPAEAALALRSGKVALVVRAAASHGVELDRQATSAGREAASISDTTTTGTQTPETRTPARAFSYSYDPTRPESRMARLTVDDALQRAMGRADVASATDEKVTEPGARYIDFLIPGLIGMNLMGSGMWGIGFAVVSARSRKLLKRLAATPMRRSHYLFSFMLSRLLFLALEVIAIIGFGWLVFGVQVRGSLLSLAIVALVGGLTFTGIGALLAARPETIEGISGWMNFIMLPMWLLSGTFFSSTRFPQVLQPFIKALPLTALNDSLRAIVNEGASLAANWPQLAVMLAWGLLSFIVALRIFKWK